MRQKEYKKIYFRKLTAENKNSNCLQFKGRVIFIHLAHVVVHLFKFYEYIISKLLLKKKNNWGVPQKSKALGKDSLSFSLHDEFCRRVFIHPLPLVEDE